MKRILYLVLIVLMIITFSSCGGNSDGDGGDVSKKGQTENQNDNRDKKTEIEKNGSTKRANFIPESSLDSYIYYTDIFNFENMFQW